MSVGEKTYEEIALEDPSRPWELHDGELRAKPGMSFEHNDAMCFLGHLLQGQLDRRHYRVRVNAGRVRRAATYYVPDVAVIPMSLAEPQRGRPGTLEVYADPQPLVVEVWSPSTGDYDIDAKLPDYRRRGDQEIWRLHSFERTLTAWRRQPDGSYTETLYRGGVVRVASLPGVAIDLDTLFDRAAERPVPGRVAATRRSGPLVWPDT